MGERSVFGWLTAEPIENWANPDYPADYREGDMETLMLVSGQLGALWLKAKERFLELSLARFDTIGDSH